jgi:small-conductance mechanosensitive channel
LRLPLWHHRGAEYHVAMRTDEQEMNWNMTLFGNSLADWLTALAVAGAINLGVGLVKSLVISRVSRVANETATSIDDAVIEVLGRTRQWLIFCVTLYIGTQYLTLPDKVVLVLKIAATVAAFLQIGMWLDGAFRFWINRYRERATQADAGAATSVGAVMFIGQLVIWTAIVLVGLQNLGVNVTALVAGLGVGGIAVALAVQNILGDLFASLSIVIDKPFVVGDFIIVDNVMGAVEYVGLKTTRIRSLGGEQIIVSNGDLLKARVRNFKRMYERRVVFVFGVVYQTTPEQLERIPAIVKQIVERNELARFDRGHFFRFGESSLDFEVVYWMKDPDYAKYMDVQQAINLDLMRALANEAVSFAYPTRTLFVEGATPEDGLGTARRGQGGARTSRRRNAMSPTDLNAD